MIDFDFWNEPRLLTETLASLNSARFGWLALHTYPVNESVKVIILSISPLGPLKDRNLAAFFFKSSDFATFKLPGCLLLGLQ